MKASVGFAFFLLFLAGYALVTLRDMGEQVENSVPTVAELSAAAWRPSHIGEMRLAEDTSLFVQFEIDGRYAGYSGCNQFFGHYRLTGKLISIDPPGASRKACPAQEMSFEIAFFESLQSATTLARADKRLALRNEQGRIVARFDAIERKVTR